MATAAPARVAMAAGPRRPARHVRWWWAPLCAGLATLACAPTVAAKAKPAGSRGRQEAMDAIAALRQGSSSDRCAAAAVLAARTDDAALAALFEAADERDEAVRACVVAALRRQPAAVGYAIAEGQRRLAALRAAAQAARATAAAPAAGEALSAATFACGQHLRRCAALDDARLLTLVDAALAAELPRFVRSGASWCVTGQSWSVAVQARVESALRDADKDVRWPVADGLRRWAAAGDAAARRAAAVVAARALSAEKDAGVRARLQQAVDASGGAAGGAASGGGRQ